MSEYTNHISGSYTSNGSSRNIVLPFVPSRFEVFIRGNAAGDNWNSTANPGVIKRAWWHNALADWSYLGVKNTNSAATDQSIFATSGGFTPISASTSILEAPQTGTAVTAANPAQVTINSHGYSNGDTVLITKTTGMLQIVGGVFTIGSVASNTFELDYLDASTFAAPATAVTARRILYPDLVVPNNKQITAVTKGSTTVVKLASTHNFVVGEKVRFNVPDLFGMVELNNLAGEVLSVNTSTNTITVDINSSNFTSFAFPTSADAAGSFTWPQAFPDSTSGSSGTLLAAFKQDGFKAMNLGSSVVGPNGALVVWTAYLDMQ